MKRVPYVVGLLALDDALAKVLADPSAVFEVADAVEEMGFHAAAQRLSREGYAHTKAGGIATSPPEGEGVVVWGKGPIKRWVKINEKFFEKDIKIVARKLRPKRQLKQLRRPPV